MFEKEGLHRKRRQDPVRALSRSKLKMRTLMVGLGFEIRVMRRRASDVKDRGFKRMGRVK